MDWWSLGEGSGQLGSELETHRIACAFCHERGNWELEHRAVKRKANSSKTLYFDTYRCGNCVGYVMVLWSASEFGGSMHSLYGYQLLPWHSRLDEWPDYWPDEVGRPWMEAHRGSRDDNWESVAVMTRSALQSALRDHQASGGNLFQEIEDLVTKGVLLPNIGEWAHDIRDSGNTAAHPKPSTATDPTDARELLALLDFLLEYLYDLPERMRRRRAAK